MKSTDIKEFFLAEYNNIACAHFNTINTISNFFKHYLIIMSIPISLSIYFSKDLGEIAKRHVILIPPIFGIISLIGFFVMLYIINLRFDALLYARTVNGIRKYFFENNNIESEINYRVLPKSIHIPHYYETNFFLFVVIAFALFNSLYLFIAIYFFIYFRESTTVSWNAISSLFPPVLFFVFHICRYKALSNWREYEYLKGSMIGIDIDGVLNKHEEQFCKFLEQNTGKKIKPEDITKIPVRECIENIDENDEHAVFNNPAYWESMPINDNANEIIGKLRNNLGFGVVLFTNRSWPNKKTVSNPQNIKFQQQWKNNPIEKITKKWLDKHNIKHDKLQIEKESTDVPKNRFNLSKKYNIKFFIEDDWLQAIKLSHICETVFLMSHLYNKKPDLKLPKNVIRVKSWNEIYEKIKTIV